VEESANFTEIVLARSHLPSRHAPSRQTTCMASALAPEAGTPRSTSCQHEAVVHRRRLPFARAGRERDAPWLSDAPGTAPGLAPQSPLDCATPPASPLLTAESACSGTARILAECSAPSCSRQGPETVFVTAQRRPAASGLAASPCRRKRPPCAAAQARPRALCQHNRCSGARLGGAASQRGAAVRPPPHAVQLLPGAQDARPVPRARARPRRRARVQRHGALAQLLRTARLPAARPCPLGTGGPERAARAAPHQALPLRAGGAGAPASRHASCALAGCRGGSRRARWTELLRGRAPHAARVAAAEYEVVEEHAAAPEPHQVDQLELRQHLHTRRRKLSRHLRPRRRGMQHGRVHGQSTHCSQHAECCSIARRNTTQSASIPTVHTHGAHTVQPCKRNSAAATHLVQHLQVQLREPHGTCAAPAQSAAPTAVEPRLQTRSAKQKGQSHSERVVVQGMSPSPPISAPGQAPRAALVNQVSWDKTSSCRKRP